MRLQKSGSASTLIADPTASHVFMRLTMNHHQLGLAIALLVAACISAAFLSFTSRESTKLRARGFDDPVEFELGGEKDPFNVTKPDDVVDGTPLDEGSFWARMRVRKSLLAGLLLVNAVDLLVAFGWSLTAGDVPTSDVIALFLRVLSAAYLFALAVWSVKQDSLDTHWPLVVHMSVLCGLSFTLLGVGAFLPDTPAAATTSIHSYPTVLRILWYTSLILTLAATWMAMMVPRGPDLHYPADRIYSEKTVALATTDVRNNVCAVVSGSCWDQLLFTSTTQVVMLGYKMANLEIGDLPILTADMRATTLYAAMRGAMKHVQLPPRFRARFGTGWALLYRLACLNATLLATLILLATAMAGLFYAPAFFLQRLVRFLELSRESDDRSWGWVYCLGLFVAHATLHLVASQLFSISSTVMQTRMRVQLNSVLFAKTLVRKDVASSSGAGVTGKRPTPGGSSTPDGADGKERDEADGFSSKQQVMTLMTTDVDRVAEMGDYLFALYDLPIEIVIGTVFLYSLLGVSCFVGLAVACVFIPVNHFARKAVVGVQEGLMKTRDERIALMNEVLGGIRMLKFMAWERSFEKRVMAVRDRELGFQKRTYIIETLFNAIWAASPLFVITGAFWHYAVVRNLPITPSIAFTSISVFNELRFALNGLPEIIINVLQSLVSLRRIEKYLASAEVQPVPSSADQSMSIALNSATITWPQERSGSSATASAASTPRQKFVLTDITLNFPIGELSLVCGKLGSGKTLLLHALLGEADLLSGHLLCPRSPPDAVASFSGIMPSDDEWIVPGVCAYVPQVAWLQNASVRENILFYLPYNEARYQKTLEVCALTSDLEVFEDGDMSEIGERGINLSGGQKARVSLARAVYSRASILFLDDVLSAVDAQTANHLFEQCIKGDLVKGRTVVLVSHHVLLCTNGVKYVAALDNGRLLYAGSAQSFIRSDAMKNLVHSGQATTDVNTNEQPVEPIVEDRGLDLSSHKQNSELVHSDVASTAASSTEQETETPPKEHRTPRKLVEEEKRSTGGIGTAVWAIYFRACGGKIYWTIFLCSMIVAALIPVFENGWVRIWSGAAQEGLTHSPLWYVEIYAAVNAVGLILTTSRWSVLYIGSLEASEKLFRWLLESVLFAGIRSHDTINRGRLLNRFGNDFAGIDSNLSGNVGRGIANALTICVSLGSIAYVGGLPFLLVVGLLGMIYWNDAKAFRPTSRELRRLDSVSRSPLYTIYGETISGMAVLRAFGASSKFLRDMLRCVDTSTSPYYWMRGASRWLSLRFSLLSSVVVGLVGITALVNPRVDASLAGFALAFVSTFADHLQSVVRKFVALEQSMVAVERVKEFIEIDREPPEFINPRPSVNWPHEGAIEVEGLAIRYAPDLPNVLHDITFSIKPGERVGILGRTGSGKSTLALSFFRFVEPSEGRILIDGIDISRIGLTDLRSRLTIVPQDPTIMSGTLRSTLDVFEEYEDAEIYEALRRVHLIPAAAASTASDSAAVINENVFRNLDSPVSEGGENFSAGEKQLICLARAILKRSKILFMDEATARFIDAGKCALVLSRMCSVDYVTDALIGKTIRTEFAESTILTIAHRLRTVVDYDRVLVLDHGRVVEYDTPAALLADSHSMFYSLCRAAGREEFHVLKHMASSLLVSTAAA